VWLKELDPARVPRPFAALLPAARRWGIGDDFYRSHAIEHASQAELEGLLRAMGDAPDELWIWLADQSENQPSSDEYVALTDLTMAYDEARLRRQQEDNP
jgi:hypothetical protein